MIVQTELSYDADYNADMPCRVKGVIVELQCLKWETVGTKVVGALTLVEENCLKIFIFPIVRHQPMESESSAGTGSALMTIISFPSKVCMVSCIL